MLTKTTVFTYCQTCFIISFLVEEGKYEKIGNEKILIGIKISTDFLLTEDGEPVNFTSFKNRKKRSPEGLEGNKFTIVEFQAAYSFYPPFLPYHLSLDPTCERKHFKSIIFSARFILIHILIVRNIVMTSVL